MLAVAWAPLLVLSPVRMCRYARLSGFSKPTFYVVARPEIRTAADLKNKIVGISSFGSDTDLAMKIFAQSGRVDPEKEMKRIVAGATATRLQGLKAGSIDSTTLSPPFNIYAEQLGLRVLAYDADYLEFLQSGFTVSDATLKSKRELIKKLIRGTLRGLQLMLKNRAETVRFIAKDYKLLIKCMIVIAGVERKRTGHRERAQVMIKTLGTAVGLV
jgi:ABC-type nitrate/sulfonate/bicarbonate transport system substrate-binding protein